MRDSASPHADLVEDLTTLNQIVEALNRAVDVRGALGSALARLVGLMGLNTGWIFVRDLPPSPSQGSVFVVEGRGEGAPSPSQGEGRGEGAPSPSQGEGRGEGPAPQEGEVGGGYVLAAHHNLPAGLALEDEAVWGGGCRCQRLCDEGRLTGAYNEVHCSRLARTNGDRSGLAVHASVPLRSGDRTLGILNVAAPDWASFSPRALALLTNVGNQMGIALERARLYDLLREQRVLEQAALLELSRQLLGRLELDDVVGYVVEEVRRLLQADASALLLPGEEPGYLDFRAASGWHTDPVAAGYRLSDEGGGGPGLVMRTQHPLLVEDAEASSGDTCGADWLRSEGFRGHAVIPLLVDGRSIGVLMVDARRPRRLDEDEVRFLHLMANQAAIAIEKARLHREEVERQQLEHELAVGRQIQLSLLPKDSPTVPGWEFAHYYQPARQMGGDFYDFFEWPGEPQRLGLVIADVADKGVGAALVMAVGRTVLRAAAADGRGPSAALSLANTLMLEHNRSDLFVTAFYATLDTDSGCLAYASAGHNRPLWRQAATGRIEELAGHGIALGVLGSAELDERRIELEEREIILAPGDLAVLYTDGVTEAMDADHRLFGEERLRAALAAHPGASAQQVLSAVVSAIEAFTGGAPQSDDLTLVVARRCPGLPPGRGLGAEGSGDGF